MYITLEISYYPLLESFDNPVHEFIAGLKEHDEIQIETGNMSSQLSGEFDMVMKALNSNMKKLMENYPSVFNIKISNTCPV